MEQLDTLREAGTGIDRHGPVGGTEQLKRKTAPLNPKGCGTQKRLNAQSVAHPPVQEDVYSITFICVTESVSKFSDVANQSRSRRSVEAIKKGIIRLTSQ